MLTLKSKVYKSNAKYSLRAENIIDTIQVKPIVNEIAEETTLYSEEITSVSINNSVYDLPVQSTVKSSYYRSVNNAGSEVNGVTYNEAAKSRVECIMAKGTTICKTETPIVTTPNVTFEFIGKSEIIPLGASGYSDYPSMSNMKSANFVLAHWIELRENKTTNDSLVYDYNKQAVYMNPWVKNIVVAPDSPQSSDVYVDWHPTNRPDAYLYIAEESNWTDAGNLNDNSFQTFTMYSPSGAKYPLYKKESAIKMHNKYLSIDYKVLKIDDYTFEVTWQLPVRVSMAMASRYIGTGDLDGTLINSYAFTDNIEKIILKLNATPINTATYENSFSLVNSALSSEQVKNENIYTLEAEELFTSQMYNGYTYENADNLDTNIPNKMIDYTGAEVHSLLHCVTDYIYAPAGSTIYVLSPVTDAPLGYVYSLDQTPLQEISARTFNINKTTDRLIRVNGPIERMTFKQHLVQFRSKHLWQHRLPSRLLTKYMNGKFVFECDVKATYALENKLTVGTEAKIKLLNGKFIERQGTVCTFRVCNIEKRFNKQEFIYSLKLLEE